MDAYHKKSKKPHIEVIDVSNSEDRGTGMHFEVNDAFLDMVKREKNVNIVTQEMLSSYVQELVTSCASNKNGFNYSKIMEDTKDE